MLEGDEGRRQKGVTKRKRKGPGAFKDEQETEKRNIKRKTGARRKARSKERRGVKGGTEGDGDKKERAKGDGGRKRREGTEREQKKVDLKGSHGVN